MKRCELKRKTPMTRSGILRTASTQKAARVKPIVCKGCRQKKEPFQPGAKVCSEACSITFARLLREKADRKRIKAERLADRQKRESMKTLNDHIAELQVIFNAYIRARDIAAGHNCICCGKPFEPSRPGGSIDAGHYRSRGSAPHLRFDERNVHAQRKNCNRPGGTTHAAFRAGMEKRIGIEALEALEADQESRNWTIPDIVAMKGVYRGKLKELKETRT